MDPFNLNADGTAPSPRSRPSWVKDRIARFDRKLEPRFRKVKWTLLAQSSFYFWRGTDHLFWADFGSSPLLEDFGGGKKTRLWVSGDAHCGNFGSFTDATGRLVYDLNDFDETVVADYQMDLIRLGVSLVLVGRENKRSLKSIHRMALECAWGYWRELKSCRWYENVRHIPWDEEASSGALRHFLGDVRKHRGYTPMLERFTRAAKDGLRFKVPGSKELETLPPETAKKLEKNLHWYAEDLQPWPGGKPRVFEVLDLARRLNAGVGSEGLKRYYALVRIKEGMDNPYRILEVKQQVKPSPWDELPKKARRKTDDFSGDSQALRVDLGYRALARHADPWLGRLEFKGDEYSVRERSPYKDTLPGDKIDEGVAGQLGAILARAHCRSRHSFAKNAFEAIKPEKKTFRKRFAVIAQGYADQIEMDFHSFLAHQPD